MFVVGFVEVGGTTGAQVKVAEIPCVFGELGKSLVAASLEDRGVELTVGLSEAVMIVVFDLVSTPTVGAFNAMQIVVCGIKRCQARTSAFKESSDGEMFADRPFFGNDDLTTNLTEDDQEPSCF